MDGIRVRCIGTVTSRERNKLVASARVSLFPLQWEEPGGTAVVETLALGTPAVGLSRGCLPELVEHGRTGWLAKSPDDLEALVHAAGRIDPRECRARPPPAPRDGSAIRRAVRAGDRCGRQRGRPPRSRRSSRSARWRRGPARRMPVSRMVMVGAASVQETGWIVSW